MISRQRSKRKCSVFVVAVSLVSYSVVKVLQAVRKSHQIALAISDIVDNTFSNSLFLYHVALLELGSLYKKT